MSKPGKLPLSEIEAEIKKSQPGALDNIPKAQRAQLIRGTLDAVSKTGGLQMKSEQSVMYSESYSGAVPHPDHLERFNELVPGSAQMIFDEFQKQAEHRRNLEAFAVQNQIRQSGRGQIFGFVLAVVFLLAGIILIFSGHEQAGITLTGGTLVSLVALFVVGKVGQSRELKEKR